MFPPFPLQYNKSQMRSTGTDAQGARVKQRSYPLTLDGSVPQQAAQKQRNVLLANTCLLAWGWLIGLITLED